MTATTGGSGAKGETGTSLSDWKGPEKPEDLDPLLELTERSLKEVKGLTEYEDQKAQRILAAVAFLAALAGALFSVVLRQVADIDSAFLDTAPLLVRIIKFLAFALFYVYAWLVIVGAGIVIFAIRPKFNVPERWNAATSHRFPKSFLFFEKILEPNERQWGEAYTAHSVNELKLEYIKNSIYETWLVADKINYKVRRLKWGVICLGLSTVVLGVWLLVLALLATVSADLPKGAKPVAATEASKRVGTNDGSPSTPSAGHQNFIYCVYNEKSGDKIRSQRPSSSTKSQQRPRSSTDAPKPQNERKAPSNCIDDRR